MTGEGAENRSSRNNGGNRQNGPRNGPPGTVNGEFRPNRPIRFNREGGEQRHQRNHP